ncbi:FAD-dependent thymidylate synthase [bacterium]|nr:FAD-dependent thymidylate synthase [bacterium]
MSEQTNPQQAEKLARPGVPDLDEILGVPFPVLDDGHVRVIDYMGDDAAIVQAARVSYGAGTKATSDDRGLIRYLLRHRHTTPFEMCSLKLHVRVPMDAWRQWIRHRTASVNETSTRYSIAIEGTQKTAPDEWRLQSSDNKQGSSGFLDSARGAELTAAEADFQATARRVYDERLELGIAREQARKDLPLCTYTEAYWKMDLHNLLHFLALRMDPHAQLEIRSYADVIGREIVARWVPQTWEAFTDYRLGALHFSRLETEVIAALGAGDGEKATALLREAGWLKTGKSGQVLRHRERQELEGKLARLNLGVPWAE